MDGLLKLVKLIAIIFLVTYLFCWIFITHWVFGPIVTVVAFLGGLALISYLGVSIINQE
jgi:hypothetical protein